MDLSKDTKKEVESPGYNGIVNISETGVEEASVNKDLNSNSIKSSNSSTDIQMVEVCSNAMEETFHVYKCDVCKQCFKRASALRNHKNINHANDKSTDTGSIFTEKVASNSGKIRQSKKTKVEILTKRNSKEIISYNLGTASEKVKESTGNKYDCYLTENNVFQCYLCVEQFQKLAVFKRHLYAHSGTKTYQCYICEAFFNRKGNLKTHLKIHTGEKPYKCSICDAAFRHRATLNHHLNTHPEIKQYQCDVCKVKFAHKSSLKRHEYVHSEKKVFTCRICNAKFGYQSTLNRHLICHSDEQKYKCSNCDKTFYRKETLNYHINKKKCKTEENKKD